MAYIIRNNVKYAGGSGSGGNNVSLDASNVVFDDTDTQMGVDNVQDAIEKLNTNIDEQNKNFYEMFIVEAVSASFPATSASFYESTVSVKKDGYVPIGVVGYNNDDSVSHTLSRYYLIYTNTINYVVRAFTGSVKASSVTFYVLYKKIN